MATMQTDPNLLGIRDTLKTKHNIGDERIGYDGEYVTIDGQRAIKPTKNINGSTFADQASWNSAAGNINAINNQYQVMQKLTGMADGNGQANPYDQQITDLLGQLQGRLTNQTPIALQDVFTNPQYGAQLAQINQQSQQAIRGAQEALGASGFARSTNLTDRAQRIQNDASNYMNTQVVPVIMQAMQAERDRETNALMSLLDVLGGQQSLYDTRENTDFNQMMELMGYQTDRRDRAEDVAYQRERDAVGDKRYEDEFAYRKEQDALAQRNLEEEKAYRMQRDSEEDRRWWSEYNRAGQQFAQSMGIRWAELDQREKERIADEAWKQKYFELDERKVDQADRELDLRENEAANQGRADMAQEEQGLVSALRNGDMTPAAALRQIDEDIALGFYTREEGNRLRSIIQKVTPSITEQEALTGRTPTLTQEQADAMPSDKEIDKLYEQYGKKQGYAKLDWRAWYKSPQGRLAGTDFETWRKLYGPKLTGG